MFSFSLRQLLRRGAREPVRSGGEYIEIVADGDNYVVVHKEQKASYISAESKNAPQAKQTPAVMSNALSDEAMLPPASRFVEEAEESISFTEAEPEPELGRPALNGREPEAASVENARPEAEPESAEESERRSADKILALLAAIYARIARHAAAKQSGVRTESKSIAHEALMAIVVFALIVAIMLIVL